MGASAVTYVIKKILGSYSKRGKEKMTYEHEKEILEKEIKKLNEEIKALGYKLGGILNVDCNFGICTFDPEADNVQEKMREIEEQKKLLEFLKDNLKKYHKKK